MGSKKLPLDDFFLLSVEKSENYFHLIRETSRRLAFITFQSCSREGKGRGSISRKILSSVMLQYFNIFSIYLIDSFNLWEFLSSGAFECRPQIRLGIEDKVPRSCSRPT